MMGLFRKKEKMWWQEGHATSTKMSRVEKILHDNWLAYQYDDVEDCFYVAIQRMETGNHRMNCVISRPYYNRVRITSYTSLPMIANADQRLLDKFAQIKEMSKFTEMKVEKKYGFVVCIHEFEATSPNEWLPYIVPVMLEHARVIDENYEDIHAAYSPEAYTSYPWFSLAPELKVFQNIPLNKICRIFNETAIIHQKAPNH